MGSELPHDQQHVYTRNLEVPAGGGVGTARAIARAYSVFATGGKELELRSKTLQELSAPAIPATHGFYDECMKAKVEFSLGFTRKPIRVSRLDPSRLIRRAPGAGGSLGCPPASLKSATDTFPNRQGRSTSWRPAGAWRSERRSIPPRKAEHKEPVAPARLRGCIAREHVENCSIVNGSILPSRSY